MSIKEQYEIRILYYNEALRYMDNAKETLKIAQKEDRIYKDVKYVKTACGTAYSAILVALDGYFIIKGVEKKKGRKNVDYYLSNIGKSDNKLLDYFNEAYKILHLYGYYDGVRDVKTVTSGFEYAYEIIEKIKP